MRFRKRSPCRPMTSAMRSISMMSMPTANLVAMPGAIVRGGGGLGYLGCWLLAIGCWFPRLSPARGVGREREGVVRDRAVRRAKPRVGAVGHSLTVAVLMGGVAQCPLAEG